MNLTQKIVPVSGGEDLAAVRIYAEILAGLFSARALMAAVTIASELANATMLQRIPFCCKK
jgi:hypothetical protein